MTKYKQTIDYLYQQLPMFHRIGSAAYKKDLTNTLALCQALDNPHQKFAAIHVAGTNGKGSTAHLLSAIFQAQGLKVGLYTSPHYKDFRERIKINGQYISKKYIIDFVAQYKTLFQQIQPSFFEMTVAMAFNYFAQQQVDIAIVEVGLGGRLDSTNIITPLISVITNISYDHQNMLGETLSQIAFEKAGIIKPNVPVVVGEKQPETKLIFEAKAAECCALITFASQNIEVFCKNYDLNYSLIDVFKHRTPIFTHLKINLHGNFQQKNIATVLQTIDVFNQTIAIQKNWQPISPQHIETAFLHFKSMTNFVGRWQIIAQNPTILCDSAHNEGGLKQVLNQLNELKYNKLHIICGFVKDKDLQLVLNLFSTQAAYYFAKANIPRGLDASELQTIATSFGLKGKGYASVKNALRAAKRQAKNDDLIVVIGSIFIVAEVI